ncbi:MAG: tetratricopeptide repeat protein [Clostridium sp.]
MGAEDIRIHLDKGNEALNSFQMFNALDEIEKAKGIDENNIDIKLLEGKLLGSLNRVGDAIDKLTEVIEVNPEFREALVERGYFRVRAGKLEEGYEDLKKAISLDESNIDGKLTLGKVCMDLEKYEEARDIYESLLNAYAPNVIGSNFVSANKFIIKELENREYLTQKEIISLAQSYLYIGDSEKSLEIINDIEVSEDSYDDILSIGLIYASNKDIEKAIEYYDKGIKLNPNASRAFILKGNALKLKGDLKESYNVLKRLIELEDFDKDVYYTLSKVAFEIGKFKEATEYCDKSIENNLNVSNSLYVKACINNRLWNFEEGNKDIDKALKIYTGDGDYYAEKSHSLRGLGYIREANDACEKALEYRLETSKINEEKGIILKIAGYYENAISWLDVAIEMEEKNVTSKFYKAICNYYLENYREALENLDEIKITTKHDGLIYGEEILIHDAMGNNERYIEILKEYASTHNIKNSSIKAVAYELVKEIERSISPLKSDNEYEKIIDGIKKVANIK